uniref:Putative restriction alleviation protein n=1 Tax=viral metagenome TaxID=1070528 RepID=A0A6M3J5B8_9ZZZZ
MEIRQWCMCKKLKAVARDGWSTCSICGGKDAYGKSKDRPPNKRKIIDGDTTIEELKLCPFCGGKASFQEIGAQRGRFCIRCHKCWAKSVFVDDYEKNIAIEQWNKRVDPQD